MKKLNGAVHGSLVVAATSDVNDRVHAPVRVEMADLK